VQEDTHRREKNDPDGIASGFQGCRRSSILWREIWVVAIAERDDNSRPCKDAKMQWALDEGCV